MPDDTPSPVPDDQPRPEPEQAPQPGMPKTPGAPLEPPEETSRDALAAGPVEPQRVTRRTTRRHQVDEEIEETITEVIPTPYQGPTSQQPRPVG